MTPTGMAVVLVTLFLGVSSSSSVSVGGEPIILSFLASLHVTILL